MTAVSWADSRAKIFSAWLLLRSKIFETYDVGYVSTDTDERRYQVRSTSDPVVQGLYLSAVMFQALDGIAKSMIQQRIALPGWNNCGTIPEQLNVFLYCFSSVRRVIKDRNRLVKRVFKLFEVLSLFKLGNFDTVSIQIGQYCAVSLPSVTALLASQLA